MGFEGRLFVTFVDQGMLQFPGGFTASYPFFPGGVP